MRNLVLLSAICLGTGLLLAAAGNYQPLNVKTGLWETTWTSSVSGRPPITPDTTQNLTPEQRERFEADMNKLASPVPKTRTNRTCLTDDKLKKDPFNNENKSCSQTVLSSTGSMMNIREFCTGEALKIDMIVHIEAADPEHVIGTVKSNTSGGGNTMNMNGKFTSRWVSAACGDTK